MGWFDILISSPFMYAWRDTLTYRTYRTTVQDLKLLPFQLIAKVKSLPSKSPRSSASCSQSREASFCWLHRRRGEKVWFHKFLSRIWCLLAPSCKFNNNFIFWGGAPSFGTNGRVTQEWVGRESGAVLSYYQNLKIFPWQVGTTITVLDTVIKIELLQ